MPPASAVQRQTPYPDRDMGLSLLLGSNYEKQKIKLQQELQLDYKQYAAKKKDLKITESRPQHQGLSLPIDERIATQEKLREERNKEYNLFLQEKAKIGRLKMVLPAVTSEVQAIDDVLISSPASQHTNMHLPPGERLTAKRDAATLTETVDNRKSTETRGRGRRRRKRWQQHRPKEPYSSEEEPIMDKELGFSHRRQQNRHTSERNKEKTTIERRANRALWDIKEGKGPAVCDENNNEWVNNSDLQTSDNMRTATRSRPTTSKDKAELSTGLMIGAAEEKTASQTRKEQYKQELLEQIAEQQRNKIREKKLELRVAATGATDPEKQPDRIKQFAAVNQQSDSWKRDVPYKPGTDLEAVGKDPNPRPNHHKPTEETERGGHPGKSHKDYSKALSQLTGKTVPGSRTRPGQGVPSLDSFNEDYHRDFSNILGEVANPRVAGFPPPFPPTVSNNYKTPYDAAYFYYGTRNPLDPNLPYNHNDLPGGTQQSGNFYSPPQRPAPLRPGGRTEATDQHLASPLDDAELPADTSKQRRERVLNYQEALRQQIKEREERKIREKEEQEQYDAKMEEEMMAYNYWGRGGGGAPIIDQNGNLVSDLNQMHRTNTESCSNGDTPSMDTRAPLSHRLPGFIEQLTPQQLRMQERYKEELKQQIEGNRQRQAEAKERMRIEEEKEEKRLAAQRARIQQQYEEEQSKLKKTDHMFKDWIHAPETQHKKEKKRGSQEGETEKKVPERDTEHKKMQLSYEREPSPPIPTLQRKQTNPVASRPSSQVSARTEHCVSAPHSRPIPVKTPQLQSVSDQQIHKHDRYKEDLKQQREPSPPIPTLQRKQKNHVASRPLSQVSARTEHSVSAPHSRPVPAKIPQLQDGYQEVIRELSALRRYLRNEQRQLEVQLGQADRQESHQTPPYRPRERPRGGANESTHKQAVQPSTRSPSSGATRVNMQNIREFNQLKYRDSASREEVCHMYPDPPTDAQTLDIQQQALLREQQRKIRRMKREEEQHDFLDQNLSHYHPRNKRGHSIHRDSILQSETTFIDLYSGDGEERVHQRRPSAERQTSAEHQERTDPRRRHDHDEEDVFKVERDSKIQPDAQSLRSRSHLKLDSTVNQHSITKQDDGDHNEKPKGLSGDEVDALSLCSALERRVSMDTVATEAWLRPGTSDTVKRSGCRERPKSGTDAPPWLTHRVT